MRKAVKWIIGILVVMILAMAAIGVFGFWMTYNEAVSSFGHDRHINMYLQNDGSVQIVWPEGMDADRYLLEIRDHESGEVTYSEYIVGQPTTILKELPRQKSTITVYTVAEYDVFMGSEPWLRLGGDAIEITDTIVLPQITDLTTQIDPEEEARYFLKFRKIIVAACPDLPPFAREKLIRLQQCFEMFAACGEQVPQISICITAPGSWCDCFDSWGCLIPEQWDNVVHYTLMYYLYFQYMKYTSPNTKKIKLSYS